ncbi:MAG: alpha/beta fold hydrolase [Paracoccaceae bacterium]|nr:alpha/beta fold hydrolase [Paracoccaceae bacterium]
MSTLEISLLGELEVRVDGAPATFPASRKARALFAYLVATGRPHRRERLCELFWDLPDDPRASLRWALTKLRAIVDTPEQRRIVADRERVAFDEVSVDVDVKRIRGALEAAEPLAVAHLESLARDLEHVFLEGLEGAGGTEFTSWLLSEREDLQDTRIAVLKALLAHPDVTDSARRKWDRTLREIAPDAAPAHSPQRAPDRPAITAEHAQKTKATSSALRAQKIGFCRVGDGTRIAYAKVGSGPPILKAANWLTHLEFDWSVPIWGRAFAELARNHTFIRYDERGCGLSDWDVKDLSFDAFVEDLEAVANALDLDRFPLIGISQGAAVSIEYAVRHPERVSALILVSGYAAGWRIGASPEEQARREAVLTLTELGWGTDNAAYRHIFSQTFMPDARPEDLNWFDAFQRQTTSPKNAAMFQEAFGHIDVRNRLSQVKAPTIVFHSRNDQRIPLEDGLFLAQNIPNARLVPLESRNHILVETEPALDVFTSEVNSFLKEVS